MLITYFRLLIINLIHFAVDVDNCMKSMLETF